LSQSSPVRQRVPAAALALCLASGCAHFEVEYQSLPAHESFEAIRPGETTRSDVLRLVGPPEEYRRPSPGEEARRLSPQQLKIVESGDVFGRGVYTYATERWTDRRWGILPVFLTLFRVRRVRSVEERWMIAFDDGGVVSQVSHVDERTGD
jgi:hypothetical protein